MTLKKIELTLLILGVSGFVLTCAMSFESYVTNKDVTGRNANETCAGRCNQVGTVPNACQCNKGCQTQGDCCDDYVDTCASCAGRCGPGTNTSYHCNCNSFCKQYNDCCTDYNQQCEGGQPPPDPISNEELAALAEHLLSIDTENNGARFISVNLQRKMNGTSVSDVFAPLLVVDPAVYNLRTIEKMVRLHDNYIAPVTTPEVRTDGEFLEELDFLYTVFNTPIMQAVQNFLEAKKYSAGRDQFYTMWFEFYARGGSNRGSSGFEHVMMGEIRNGVTGFHNWVFYAKEEALGNLNYGGYMDHIDLGSRGGILEFSFTWLNNNKPISSMFLGSSPEFEMAIYTLCWHARRNAKCPITLQGRRVDIQTYDLSQNGMLHVGSAYPDLSP